MPSKITLAEDSKNNIYKIYLKGKFLVSLFTNKRFEIPLEVGVLTMLRCDYPTY